MNVLLSNDDGIRAPGLAALEQAVADLGQVTVVAPEKERSAVGHALTLHKPLRIRPEGAGRWSVSGSPADSVYIALHKVMEQPPDLVITGVNRGPNMGSDVHYSGTVAAAREACLAGHAALAVSLALPRGEAPHWASAGPILRPLVKQLSAGRLVLPPGVFLNLNIPNLPADQIKGLVPAPLSMPRYATSVASRTDPRGNTYCWIGGSERGPSDPLSDAGLVARGFATVTALTTRPMDHATQEALSELLSTTGT
jgi:5'-nucleotidase